jgi:hypothetical protein
MFPGADEHADRWRALDTSHEVFRPMWGPTEKASCKIMQQAPFRRERAASSHICNAETCSSPVS